MKPKLKEFYVERQHFRGYGVAYSVGEVKIWRKIANALANERVLAACDDESKWAALYEVLNASSERIEARCEFAKDCAACQFQCMDPRAQREFKAQQWKYLIKRVAGIELELSAALAPKRLWHFRQRAELKLFSNNLGIRAAACANIDFVPLRNCPVQNLELSRLITAIEARVKGIKNLENIKFCCEANSFASRLTLFYPNESKDALKAACSELCTIPKLNILSQALPTRGSHLYGELELENGEEAFTFAEVRNERLVSLHNAWTSTAPENAVRVAQILEQYLDKFPQQASLLEIGCGCGTHFRALKAHCKDYTGIDLSWSAIRSAQQNQRKFAWQGEFYTANAEKYLQKQFLKQKRYNVIVLHSARLPYSHKVIEYAQKLAAKILIIVAPTAFALAKSTATITAFGYECLQSDLVEIAPWSYHQMGVALFLRKL
ncbi:MAG: methyltransferase domain-containing protein [Bradymonadales bacterium]|jgi:23S rRNA (uracil1939-C5)-methyltransferase